MEEWFRQQFSDPTRLIGILAAASLSSAIAYQVGYLYEIDYRLASFFTFQDALVSGLAALPIIAVALPNLWMAVSEFLAHRKTLSRPGVLILISVLVLFVFLVAVSVYPTLAGWFLVSSTVAALLFKPSAGEIPSRTKLIVRICVFAFLYFFTIFMIGRLVAGDDIQATDYPYTLLVSGAADGEKVSLLKAGEEVIIVKNEKGLIKVIPRAETVRLERNTPKRTKGKSISEIFTWLINLFRG